MPLKDLLRALSPLSSNGRDVVVYRLVVTAMGVGLVGSVGGIVLLAALGRPVPVALGTVAATIAGSMATMLLPHQGGKGPDAGTPQRIVEAKK